MGPLPAQVLAALGIYNATIHTFTYALQEVVAVGRGAALPSPSTAAPSGRVTALLLLHIRFACRLEGDADLTPIWEEMACVKGHTEGIYILNQTLLRGIPSY